MITIIISNIIFPILVVIQIGVGVGIGAFLLLTIISSIIILFRLYLIQTHVKNKTGVYIASTLNITENLPATELENGETYKDLSNREFEITENDLNYSTITSLKGTRCGDKFSPVHNERKKKSYASDNRDCSHSATVMKKTFTNAASNYEEIDLTPCDVSVQKETQMQKGPETWDPSHIYSAVNKKSTKTAVKETAMKSTHDNCIIYAVVDKKKTKVPPRSSVTDYIPDSTAFEQEEEAPEIPPFDLSMMYPVD